MEEKSEKKNIPFILLKMFSVSITSIIINKKQKNKWSDVLKHIDKRKINEPISKRSEKTPPLKR